MSRALVACLVAVVVTAGSGPVWAAAPGRHAPSGASRLLEVPFLPQTEDLCGGAALAMVLRYWGAADVQPADFAPLVDRGAAGIPTNVLASAVRTRGWQSVSVEADAASGNVWLRDQVERGRPVIALIAVGPARYHYVVVVAWTGTQVVVHDPARGPFVVLPHAAFEGAWALAGRWALLVLPPETPLVSRPAPALATPIAEPGGTNAGGSSCALLVSTLVALAKAGDVPGADAGLTAALQMCPDEPAAWRELAGIRFLQSRWAEASALAEQSAALDPSDVDGRDLLATSRFLNDEPERALAQWNRIGSPDVDVVRVVGARRTRHPVVSALIDLPPRVLLTPERFNHASRRLQELPSAVATRLRYRPIGGGLADLDAVVVERATVPRGPVPLVAAGARAWVQREAGIAVASPTGSGELWTAAWRWWERRPRVAASLTVPSPSWFTGVTTIAGSWERPTYQTSPATVLRPAVVSRQARRRASVAVTDWVSSRLRWSMGLALDTWDRDRHVAMDAALDARGAGDRISMSAGTVLAAPTGSGQRFATAGVQVALRSTRDRASSSWMLDAGVDAASTHAPFDLWAGAGAGQARTPLLRAHPLLSGGVITGPMFGRQMAHATVEYQHSLVSMPAGTLSLAAFVDAADVRRPLAGDGLAHADLGAGARFSLPGRGGTMRVDVARGLRDGRVVVSAGWLAPWPGR